VNPIVAARLLDLFLKGMTVLVEREVLDVDEEAFREDRLVVRLFGYLLVPSYENLVQAPKTLYSGTEEELAKEAIAEYIVETMEPNTPYILGPGSTVKAVCRKLGLDCTLLGVDVVLNRELLVKDAWEKDLLDVIERYGKVKLVVTPIGGQGFLFGRGNQQISPRVLSMINKEDIIVVSTERKIRDVNALLVDTGDKSTDAKLTGYIKVLVDYNRFIVARVISETT
ncbi:MAG: ATP-NAD kinase, partial [Desulfurococcaceae archaeon]